MEQGLEGKVAGGSLNKIIVYNKTTFSTRSL
jgi:hypothetical protein